LNACSFLIFLDRICWITWIFCLNHFVDDSGRSPTRCAEYGIGLEAHDKNNNYSADRKNVETAGVNFL